MSMSSEFKDFVMKGNVVDLAVGVIIGAAFGKIVDSMVNDLIMPIVSSVFGAPNFSNMYIKLADTALPEGTPENLTNLKAAAIPVLAYGNFITILINFLILAFVIFMLVKQVNRLKKTEVAAPAATPEDTVLLREIRNALAKK